MNRHLSRAFPILLLLSPLFITSCHHDGCTDPLALNQDKNARKDDGSCTYSTVTFYARFGSADAVQQVNLTIDGVEAGSIKGTNWPDGPGDCAATGTIVYQFKNANAIKWRAEIITAGETLNASGTIVPAHDAICIKVNVTP